MAEKYYLKGVLAFIEDGRVHLNEIDEEQMEESTLLRILADPLKTSNYSEEKIKLRYFPPLKGDASPSRQSYVELRYGMAESGDMKGNRGTLKDKGQLKVAGYLGYTKRQDRIEGKDKELLRGALSAYYKAKS